MDRPSLSERVAEEIRAMLARRRVSGRELARRLGVSSPWVSQRLTGQTTIDLDDLEAIAGALDVPVSALLPGDIVVNERSHSSTERPSRRRPTGRRSTPTRPPQPPHRPRELTASHPHHARPVRLSPPSHPLPAAGEMPQHATHDHR